MMIVSKSPPALRDTQPRRLVLQALRRLRKPAAPKDVFAWITRRDAVNLVTVYRILRKFEEVGMVHRHPSTGGITLCSLPGKKGHHGFLSCQKCGRVEEFADAALCAQEDRIARRAGFRPRRHLSEILGVCSHCQ
jgi:Fur family ferric uptake transcriptional regulator